VGWPLVTAGAAARIRSMAIDMTSGAGYVSARSVAREGCSAQFQVEIRTRKESEDKEFENGLVTNSRE
jgi:hypothetical protein